MTARLSKRKRIQVRRIFDRSESKRSQKVIKRLRGRARARGDFRKSLVFHTIIEGKKRTVKMSAFETLARANAELLQSAHKRAVKNGEIKPVHYTLSRTEYVYVSRYVGIMETLPGVGYHNLLWFLQNLKWGKSPEDILEAHKAWQDASEFYQKNPGISIEKLNEMFRELYRNLIKISNNRTLFSFDLAGMNNILIQSYNLKSGNFRIALVDQLYPSDEEEVREMLRKRRKRKE